MHKTIKMVLARKFCSTSIRIKQIIKKTLNHKQLLLEFNRFLRTKFSKICNQALGQINRNLQAVVSKFFQMHPFYVRNIPF